MSAYRFLGVCALPVWLLINSWTPALAQKSAKDANYEISIPDKSQLIVDDLWRQERYLKATPQLRQIYQLSLLFHSWVVPPKQWQQQLKEQGFSNGMRRYLKLSRLLNQRKIYGAAAMWQQKKIRQAVQKRLSEHDFQLLDDWLRSNKQNLPSKAWQSPLYNMIFLAMALKDKKITHAQNYWKALFRSQAWESTRDKEIPYLDYLKTHLRILHTLTKPSHRGKIWHNHKMPYPVQDRKKQKRFLRTVEYFPNRFYPIKRFRQKIKKWQKTISNEKLKYHRGRLRFFGRENIAIRYNVSPSRNEKVLLINDKPLLVMINDDLYWSLNKVVYHIQEVLNDNLDSKPPRLNLSLLFTEEGGQNSIQLRFRLTSNGGFYLNWDNLWHILTRLSYTVFNQKNTYTLYHYKPANPFQSKRMVISAPDGLPDSFNIHSLDDNKPFILDNLVFASNQGTLNPKKYLKGATIKKLNSPIDLQSLNYWLLSQITSARKADSPNASKSDIQQKINRHLQQDFAQVHGQSPKRLQRLARKYIDLAEKHPQIGRLQAIAAYLHYRTYSFAEAQKLYKRYFQLKKENQFEDKDFHVSLSFVRQAEHYYLKTLIHSKKLDQAYKYIIQRINKLNKPKEMTPEILRKNIQYRLKGIDISARSQKWDQAITNLRKLSDYISQKAQGKLLSPASLNLIKKAYLLQLQVIGFRGNNQSIQEINKQYGQIWQKAQKLFPDTTKRLQWQIQKSIPDNWPNSREDKIRISSLPILPGQGKNYCVPIALQFLLRLNGDSETTQKQIAKALDTGERGTNIRTMFSYMRKRGYQPRAFPANINAAARYLKQGVPLLALISVPTSEIGHMVAVIGVDKKSQLYYLYEPSSTLGFTTMTYKQLRRRQRTTGNIFITFVPQNKVDTLALSYNGNDNNEQALRVLKYIDQISKGGKINKLHQMIDRIRRRDSDKQFADFATYHKARLHYIHLKMARKNAKLQKKIRKKIDGILRHYRNQKEEKHYMLMRLLAHLSIMNLEQDWAKAFLFRAIEDNPYDAKNLHLLGNIFRSEKQYRAAKNLYLKAYRTADSYYIRPQSYEKKLLYSLAMSSLKQKSYKKMLIYLIKAANFTRPNNRIARYTLQQMVQRGHVNTAHFIVNNIRLIQQGANF